MNNDVETGLLNKMQKTTIILSLRMELLRITNYGPTSQPASLTADHLEPKMRKNKFADTPPKFRICA